MTPPNFTNPYRSFDGKTLRLNLDAPTGDVNTIRLVLMEHGALQTAWAKFLNHLADYVRTNNLTIDDRDKFIEYINSRCATDSTNGNASGADERRTTKGLRKVRA